MARATAAQQRVDRNAELAAERAAIVEKDSPPQTERKTPESDSFWSKQVADRNGSNPFFGRAFLRDVVGGRAGIGPLKGAWPKTGPKKWRVAAGVTALQVAYVLQVPEDLVLAWEDGEEPCPDNWTGGDGLDDDSARRLYGAFRGYAEAGPWPDPPTAAPVPPRPPAKIIGGDDFPRKALLEAADLGYEVPVVGLAGEGKFLRVVVLGEVVGIPTLEDVPAGSELKRLRETFNYTPERLGVLLGAAASRVLAWEDEVALPGADCDGGLAAALRLYGTLALLDEIRNVA